jgi:hypothetical protein
VGDVIVVLENDLVSDLHRQGRHGERLVFLSDLVLGSFDCGVITKISWFSL